MSATSASAQVPSNRNNINARIDNLQDYTDRRVLQALRDSQADLRTIEGLERETGLSRAQVELVLTNYPSLVRQALVRTPAGQYLYALKNRPITWKERLATVRMFVAKTYQ